MENISFVTGSTYDFVFIFDDSSRIQGATITCGVAKYNTDEQVFNISGNDIVVSGNKVIATCMPTKTQNLQAGSYQIQIKVDNHIKPVISNRVAFSLEKSIV